MLRAYVSLCRTAATGLVALALALPGVVPSATATTASRSTAVRADSALPTDFLVPSFDGAPVKARPIPHRRLPQHPFLAGNGRSSMHNDAYSSDAYEVSGPLGRNLEVTSASYGIRECATITFDSQDRIVALCGGLEGFMMMLIDPVTLEAIDELTMPGRDLTKPANPFTDICGGTYFFLTPDDHAFATTTEARSGRSARPAAGLEKVQSWELAPHIPEGDCVVATAPDWNGRVWFFTQQGTVGTLNPRRASSAPCGWPRHRGSPARASTTRSPVDETGGVYVVTTHATYRLDAGRTAKPRVTWRRSYDRGIGARSPACSLRAPAPPRP